MIRYEHVIIGNSAAAIAAVEAIRGAGDKRPVALVGEEPYSAYARHLISYFLSGAREETTMRFRPASFYTDNGVDARLGVRAEQIDWQAKAVCLSDGSAIGYNRLLLAVGAQPITPPLPGRDLGNVFTFTTLTSAAVLKAALPRIGRVVVIGGGLIGLQVAEALAGLGKAVSVVELMPRLLAPVLDQAASDLVAATMRNHGISLYLGKGARTLLPAAAAPAEVGAVELTTGETLAADAVIFAVGVAPRLELVRDTAVQTERGILVDSHMQTTVPGVYAAGDVAAGLECTSGTRRPVPVWPNAVRQGRIAGWAMAGQPQADTGSLMMNAAHFFGLPVISAGLHDPAPDAGCRTLSAGPGHAGAYRKLVLRGDRLVGFVTAGPAVDKAGILYGLIRARTSIDDHTARRLLERCDLIALDENARRRRLSGLAV